MPTRRRQPGTALVAVAAHAMATRFEVIAWGRGEPRTRAAGEQALEEVLRLETQLSRFRTDSDVYELNATAALRPVRVEPRLFALLQRAAALSAETDGAFDPTVGPLMDAWGFAGGDAAAPEDSRLAEARARTGMHLVLLDSDASTVKFAAQGVSLDLGAFGKGYAVEQAAGLLRECGVGGALIHGGTSTACAVGAQADGSPWPAVVRHPVEPDREVARLGLEDRSLGVSAPHGRQVTVGGETYGHVIDPRTGRPTARSLLAAVACPSPADADALSTALLVRGPEWLAPLLARRPGTSACVVTLDDHGAARVARAGGL